MESFKQTTEVRMQKSLKAFQEELASLRTGRANASIFDKIMVDSYGTLTPLNQVATISVPEARLIVIQPWDKSMLPAIEKAIQGSSLSLNPNNDGKIIRISLPPLNEERRKEIVKVAKTQAENARVSIRNIRREINDEIKAGDLTEDEQKKAAADLQKTTDSFISEIDGLVKEKEKEILEF